MSNDAANRESKLFYAVKAKENLAKLYKLDSTNFSAKKNGDPEINEVSFLLKNWESYENTLKGKTISREVADCIKFGKECAIHLELLFKSDEASLKLMGKHSTAELIIKQNAIEKVTAKKIKK
jgi:hypothetical protein